ncbi:uncharacterized protein LOC110808703 [Carica papaya]|uniref:uncharacterized protein LOC110808703 n=1 Tax=Carica papaya TaxID=3649 RepID=UPI000B8CD031|nr:uncharacterized protein LOC110808703 [Carica papaya]
MPKYAKFLKKILAKKKSLEDHEIVMFTEECSAIIQNKLPPKVKDLGTFTIPCIYDVKPPIISLQLVNNFIFHIDFVVLDMEVGREVPLILQRPFLATSKKAHQDGKRP